MKKVTWTVRRFKLIGWNLTRHEGVVERIEWHAFKRLAVNAARSYCRLEWEKFHIPSELLIADRKGRYTDQGSSYGPDPRESAG